MEAAQTQLTQSTGVDETELLLLQTENVRLTGDVQRKAFTIDSLTARINKLSSEVSENLSRVRETQQSQLESVSRINELETSLHD